MRRPLTEVASWPSPVTEKIDSYASVEPGRVTLASGASVDVHLTSPVDGVVRVTVGGPPRSSPMLVDGLSPATFDGPVEAGPLRTLSGAFPAGRLADGSGWLESIPLAAGAAVYGGGESFQGPDLRGRRRTLVNVETHGASGFDLSYLNVPLLWSSAGWGLLFNTGGPVRCDLGAVHSESAVVVVEDEVLDVFVLQGSGVEILRQYHALTGLPGRFPDWGLGVWTSRCSYLSEAEIATVLDGYAEANCPVDVVHVDAWVEGNVIEDLTCNWNIDRSRFPEGWVSRLGTRVSLWHNPYVLKGSERAVELESRGLLVDGAVTADKDDRFVIDFTNPDAVVWWQERVRETMAAEGNAAFKPDFAEELPEGSVMFDGRPSRSVRNEYALLYQRATHTAMGGPDEEVALFCRSGWAGAQRYPCHWVGDTPSTWAGMVTALRACLSLSLSGFAFVSHDVGGFWTGGSQSWVQEAFRVMDNSDVPADVEPELFGRWAQWGAFSPVLRFHGTGRREPWAYPDPWGAAAVEACWLRSTVLHPLLEQASSQASSVGLPMMRPPALTHPEAGVDSLQYLLGDDVLVAPILEPGGRRTLWVPPGRWSPLVGLAEVEGPGWITVECGPEQFPAWLRL